ncbi:Carboxylesterase type B [Botryosphaeria dothidea]|uniref:Carboxylic ester hydrolase n=1 Tax=Botryosphaeria dothidea TaxID=55169 RepID=A0A8H4N212_9PEZI|nr:Carboxylesterase type B [Botryosphaeria dothidea]
MPETIREPYLKDLEYRGFIEGSTIRDKDSGKELAHYFGGLPYGLPPIGPFRWRSPRPLPPCYRYGTRANPGRFTGNTSMCPQGLPTWVNNATDNSHLWDEDCLQCNIWVPAGTPPPSGWPVLFYIHGGFLQVGNPNEYNPVPLLSETPARFIIVLPAYRLNLFGFLASRELKAASGGEPVGNLGFWDQRLALEWTHKNISYFGGDAGNITVAGYSAGSHSAFKQLAYDLYLPPEKAVVRRAIMWSNGPGMQPKSLVAAQDQFDELLAALDIPLTLSSSEKVARLRALAPPQLLAAIPKMQRHQFRAVVDDGFVRKDLYKDIDSGVFAQRMRARGVALLTGECRDEHCLYGTWYPPAANTLEALRTRLRAEYPAAAVDALVEHYYPDGKLPGPCADWRDAFGRVYADMQVHHLERGFVDKLHAGGAGDLVFRYRVEWRLKCCDRFLPPDWGVTHTADKPIWWWGNGMELTDREKKLAWEALTGPYVKFVNGEVDSLRKEWGTTGPKQVRRIDPQGRLSIWEDEMWDEGTSVWNALRAVGATEAGGRNIEESAKL